VLWEFQTGAGVNATASLFMYKGHEKVVIYSAGNMFGGTPAGDSVYMFSLNGTLGPSEPPAPITARNVSVSVKDADAQSGGVVFTRVCVACHGEEGRGGHGGGPDITAVTSPGVVATAVTNGKNNKMPPFAASLSPNEIRDVAVFVATQLGKDTTKH
jgi:quinohemoprotein ethanol dehydrogenase